MIRINSVSKVAQVLCEEKSCYQILLEANLSEEKTYTLPNLKRKTVKQSVNNY